MNKQISPTGQGRQCNFLQFLHDYTKVIIPIIQRDYAQGRLPENLVLNKSTASKQLVKTSLYEEVRENFVESLKSALTKNKPLVLDYIYGSVPVAGEDKIFYPIDGQQRLTTLFLLYWYVASKEGKIDKNLRSQLKKFTYETRDTSQEFCAALSEMQIDISTLPDTEGALSTKIKDDSKYYNIYDNDPTIRSMLVMLDTLHCALSPFSGLWDKLSNITFWELDLQNFGLTDDLFVKMNARGKRLSRFDMFKSDLEFALKNVAIQEGKIDLEGCAKTWITEVDNDYLDNLWTFDNVYCERNMFRICMFIAGCFGLIRDHAAAYNDKWISNDSEVNYREQVKEIAENKELLPMLCKAFVTFPEWSKEDDAVYNLLITSSRLNKSTNNWVHNSRVRLFAIIYWHAMITDARCKNDFDSFIRIVNNYIYGFREYSIREGQFSSSISNATIAPKFKFIKKLIDDFSNTQDSFKEFILNSHYDELSFEREKLQYPHFEDIEALEKLPFLGRNIQNFFHDNTIFVSAKDLNEIVGNNELCQLTLRIILSYANSRVYGKVANLVFDRTTSQTRRKLIVVDDDRSMAFYHKFAISRDGEFGDKVLSAHEAETPEIKALHYAVKEFAKAYANSTGTTVRNKLKSLYNLRLSTLKFPKDDILDYLIKYDEFYCENGIYILVRNPLFIDDAYDIYCTNKERNLYYGYYQPFYKAIANKINEKFTNYNDNTIKRGYTLSNGWKLIIKPEHNFLIEFNGNPPQVYAGQDSYTLQTTGDCIENICNFLKDIMGQANTVLTQNLQS